jgi:hypothetical protein
MANPKRQDALHVVKADDHHFDDSAARLGPVKALRFASPLRGLTALTGPQASRVGFYVMVERL